MVNKVQERIEKIFNGDIPNGYKKINSMIIPEEWELKKIGDFARKVRRKNKKNLPLEPCSVSKQHGVIYQKEKFNKRIATKDTMDYYVLKKGEFVYDPMSAYYGAVGRQNYDEDVVVSPAYEVFNVEGINKDFFEQVFMSDRSKKLYAYLSYGGNEYWKRMKLSWDSFCDINISVPPLNEQEYIALILNDYKKLINIKKQIIEQKKERKKGLMQKLLTGEWRFPGFEGEWEEVELGDVLKQRKEVGFNELELLAITSSKGVVKRTEVDIKDNSNEDKSKYKRILPNDIGYNTMRMWQGVSGVSRYEGIVSPAYTILKPTNKVDSLFMSYLFKLPKVIDLFKRYSQGLVNDTLNLKYINLKIIKVVIPSDTNEQKAISEVLHTIDKEIELLVKEKNILLEQQRCLIQLLLTGKVRVKD